MKTLTIYFISLILLFPNLLNAQTIINNNKVDTTKNGNYIYDVTEQKAEFPGGQAKMYEFLAENIHYPAMARENCIQGKIYVQFIIEKDGTIDPDLIRIIKGLSPETDAEVMAIIKAMPNWTPAKQNGEAVASRYVLPVVFKLSAEDCGDKKKKKKK